MSTRVAKELLLKSHTDIILRHIDNIQRSEGYSCFIKGGHAWSRVFGHVDHEAFISSNVDLEFIIIHYMFLHRVTQLVFKMLNDIISELYNTPLNNGYTATYTIRTSSNIDKDKPKRSANGSYMPEWEVIRNGFSYMIDYELLKKRSLGQQNDNLVGKKEILLYIPIYMYGPEFNIPDFNSHYTFTSSNTHLLNKNGLLLHTIMLLTDRRDKGINIDKKRRDVILDRYFRNQANFLKEIEYYNTLFGKSETIYDENVRANMYRLFINNYFPKAIPTIDSFFVDYYRPYLNAIVSEINSNLKHANINAKCFVVGGDAIRRYTNTIQTSADIDVKLLYAKKENRRDIIKIVSLICSDYIVSINTHTFQKNTYAMTIGNDNNTLEHFLHLDNVTKTRLRSIVKHTGWDLDLITIDFMYNLKYRLNMSDDVNHLPITFGLLDVAIILDPKLKSSYYVEPEPNFCYASKQFLIKDLLHTLHTNSLRQSRVFAGKNTKNDNRLRILQGETNNYNQKRMLNVVTRVASHDVEVVRSYYNIFVNLMFSKGLIKRDIKYKIPFGKKRLAKISTNTHAISGAFTKTHVSDLKILKKRKLVE
jgi:hypothetical protein